MIINFGNSWFFYSTNTCLFFSTLIWKLVNQCYLLFFFCFIETHSFSCSPNFYLALEINITYRISMSFVAFFYTGVDLCFDLLHNMYDSLSFLLSLCSHLHHSKLLSRVMFFIIIIIIIIMVSSSQSLLQCNKLQVNHTAGFHWSMIGKECTLPKKFGL